MWRGLYTAAAGMVTEMTRTDVIANNLANANTTGYKRDRAIDREFEPMLLHRINDKDSVAAEVTTFKGFSLNSQAPIVGTLGLGACTDEIATDYSQGNMQSTGNPLDLAIAGDGFFAIQTDQGVRYTRNGNFYRGSNGRLVTSRGESVLDTRGRQITLPAGVADVQFGDKGEIYAGGNRIAQLQFVQFNDRRAVVKQGDSLYVPRDGAQPQPATGDVQQGLLERSNSNTISDMVELIANYRTYEAGSKAVTTQDAMLDKSVNDVGRL